MLDTLRPLKQEARVMTVVFLAHKLLSWNAFALPSTHTLIMMRIWRTVSSSCICLFAFVVTMVEKFSSRVFARDKSQPFVRGKGFNLTLYLFMWELEKTLIRRDVQSYSRGILSDADENQPIKSLNSAWQWKPSANLNAEWHSIAFSNLNFGCQNITLTSIFKNLL